jgi:hypothetical protein
VEGSKTLSMDADEESGGLVFRGGGGGGWIGRRNRRWKKKFLILATNKNFYLPKTEKSKIRQKIIKSLNFLKSREKSIEMRYKN